MIKIIFAKKNMKNILKSFCFLLLVTSCSKDDTPKDYTAENDAEIQAYIAANSLDTQESSTGLYYVIDEVGTGYNPISTDRVKVVYTGYYTDGTIFDASSDEGASFVLGYAISGFIEGLTYFKEGGSGKLIIPAHLAYGSNDYNGIPGGSVLIFDFELIYVNYEKENDAEIQTYLSENNLTAEKSDSGLYYIIENEGTGNQPTQTDNVKVAYKGYYLDGTIFDQNASGYSTNLQNVIKGWTEGIPYFKEGGSGKLIIPAHLGYGNYDYSTIPGGSVLIFDVELLEVN